MINVWGMRESYKEWKSEDGDDAVIKLRTERK